MSLSREVRKFSLLMSQLQKQGGNGLPVDFPIRFEEEVRSVLLQYFNGEKTVIESELIVQGRLLTLLQASFNPETQDFREDLFLNYLGTHFNEVYALEILDDLSTPVLGAWEAGALAMQDSVGATRTGIADETSSGRATLKALALGTAAGTAGFVYLGGIRTALKGSVSLVEADRNITTFLRSGLDSRAENYYNMLAAWSVAQSRNFGRVSAASGLGVETLVWTTSGDEVVCPTCLSLEGMRFSVGSLYDKMAEYADAVNTEVAKTVLPWLKAEEGYFSFGEETVEVTQDNSEILISNGIGIPPIHGECRCELEAE